jgi:4-hydroxyphenylpyruvate dioxygenase-like putative hemolysin
MHAHEISTLFQDTTNMARNRGFAFVEFNTHEEAAKAHAKIMKPGFRLAGALSPQSFKQCLVAAITYPVCVVFNCVQTSTSRWIGRNH